MEMGLQRRRAPDERPDQLLDAAEAVLLRKGLASTTVADVAEAAGVAKGTVYLYFDSKDALLAGLRSRYLARFGEAVGASMGGPARSPARRLKRFVTGLFEFSAANHELHHLLFHEAGFREEDAFAGARRILSDLVADGVASGDFAVDDVEATTSFLLHGLHGLLVDTMHSGGTGRSPVKAATRLAERTLSAT